MKHGINKIGQLKRVSFIIFIIIYQDVDNIF